MMQTLEELSAQRASDEAQRLAHARQLAAPVLADLRESDRVVKKRGPSWVARAQRCANRHRLLVSEGVKDTNLERGLAELFGGPLSITGGLLASLGPQISGHVRTIEDMTLADLIDGAPPSAWSMAAANDRACIGAIEDTLAALEYAIADGEPLYREYQRRIETKRSTQPAAPAAG